MTKYRILIPVAIPREGFEQILPEYELVYPSGEAFTDEETAQHIVDCVAMVSIFGRKVSSQLIEKAPQLKIIANFGAGYDNVDVAYAKSKGIVVTNCPDPVTEPTAELAFAMMLALARRVSELDAVIKQQKPLRWGTMFNLSSTLIGKQLGIVGMGAIGKAVARRAIASGMKVVYHNRKPMLPEVEAQCQATYVSMAELLSSSDVVSLHVPLTADTRHLIDKDALQRMKASAILINTARGAVVDEAALVDALKKGIIGGAGLDVYENEPVISPELFEMASVVLTPHTGSATIETRAEMSRVVATNIRAFVDGKVPPNKI
jgi:glyoxylate reductase